METIQYNELIHENVHCNVLSSGIKCYIIPKTGFVEKQAMFAVNYGSTDNRFLVGDKLVESPEGVAHFLEHKLFEEKEGNAFDKFSALGGSVNAFTNFSSTAYYFNTTEKFHENYQLLMNFVSNPYFTDENVEKEKGIISQEINMYADNPMWRIYFNMLEAMYHVHPVRQNIAGTIPSIQSIHKDILYHCYQNFYTPSNAVVFCVGDIVPNEIYDMTEQHLRIKPTEETITRVYGEEPDTIVNDHTEMTMNIDRPLFHFGFKDTDFSTLILKKSSATKILLDMLAGESSPLYETLYEKGLIDGSFSYEYFNGVTYGCSIFSGFSNNVMEVKKYLLEEIHRYAQNGFDNDTFLRIQRKHIGRFIKGFNSIDAIASGGIDYFSKNVGILDAIDSYVYLTIDDITQRLKDHFVEANMVTSLILPMH